jgi:hypothetical protein
MENFTNITSNRNLVNTGLVAKYKPLLNCLSRAVQNMLFISVRDDEKWCKTTFLVIEMINYGKIEVKQTISNLFRLLYLMKFTSQQLTDFTFC